jgi:hypothetical protein
MTTATDEILDLDPQQNLKPFARSPVVLSFIIATLVHIGLIGVTSLGYIYELADPLGALEARKAEEAKIEAAAEAKRAIEEAQLKEAAAKAAAARAAAEAAKPAETAPADSTKPPPDKVKNPDYVEKLNETAAPPVDPVFNPEL